MSLNWDIRKIENCDEVCKTEEGTLSSLTEALIWNSMAIGIGTITEKNWHEAYIRTKMVEKISGCMLRKCTDDGIEDVPVTPEDIKKHIGLNTNVSPLSKTKFINNMYRRVEDTSKRQLRDAG